MGKRYGIFDRRNIVILGYAAFAFASGAFIGAVIRRTLPAMATTLAVYAFTIGLNPNLPAPDSAVQACTNQANQAFHVVVRYLPADRCWTLQWLELGIFAALALSAAAGCCWWVTKRTQ